jgi:integrase
MSQTFINMMSKIMSNFDRIKKELRGSTFHKKEQDGETIEVEVVPAKDSFIKRSHMMSDIVFEFYPEAEILGSSASTLLKIWTDEIMTKDPADLQHAREALPLLHELLLAIYPNEGSLSSRVALWRKPIKDRFGLRSELYSLSLQGLGLTSERQRQRREDYQTAIRESVRDRKEAGFTEGDVLRVLRVASSSSSMPENIVAVLLATGSRLIECLKISRYEEVEGHPELVRICNIAKKRDGPAKPIVRPLIGLKSDAVIELVAKIRKAGGFKDMGNSKATAKVDAQVNKVATDHFGEHVTGHKLRHIWASLAYQKFGGNVPEQEWLREMLGHESADTSLIYTQLIVKPDEEAKGKGLEVTVKFPQFMNPLHVRIGEEEQMKLLDELSKAYKEAGQRMLQRDAKQHRFGSVVVNKYWKRRYAVM